MFVLDALEGEVVGDGVEEVGGADEGEEEKKGDEEVEDRAHGRCEVFWFFSLWKGIVTPMLLHLKCCFV